MQGGFNIEEISYYLIPADPSHGGPSFGVSRWYSSALKGHPEVLELAAVQTADARDTCQRSSWWFTEA